MSYITYRAQMDHIDDLRRDAAERRLVDDGRRKAEVMHPKRLGLERLKGRLGRTSMTRWARRTGRPASEAAEPTPPEPT